MSSAAMLQTQISAIMDVLAKAAVAEISQLLEEDAAALHHEIRRRNDEIQELKTRLLLTETRLQRLAADRCSIGVQVEIMDTGVTAHSLSAQADDDSQESVVFSAPLKDSIAEDKPHLSLALEVNSHQLKREEPVTQEPNAEEEELSGLEFQMKIEQVEELVDQKLNQAEQKHEGQTPRHDGNSHSWSSGKEYDDQESLIESQRQSQSFPDPYVMMEDPMSRSSSGLFTSAGALENERHTDVEYDLNLLQQDSHRRSPTSVSDSTPFGRPSASHSSSHLSKTLSQTLFDPPRLQTGPKPFRCEECGKGFTQRTRLITHRRVHTGEKPFRCQLCGKMFSRQDNCLRHMRLHSGQRW